MSSGHRSPADVVELLARDPGRTVVVVDYDGSLAPIVDDPEAAVPAAGAVTTLARLQARVGCVAVVSGRPVSFLERHLPAGLTVVGLYGLEQMIDGKRVDHPQSGTWREAIHDVATAPGLPDGARLEDKGLSLTVHYRGHPEVSAAAREWAEAAAHRAGLVVRDAKMSVELHPPVATDKGTVVDGLIGDTSVLVFAGDDVGDLAAFDALDRAATAGIEVMRIAVGGPETPRVLADRADVVVDGPAALVSLLAAAADRISPS